MVGSTSWAGHGYAASCFFKVWESSYKMDTVQAADMSL